MREKVSPDFSAEVKIVRALAIIINLPRLPRLRESTDTSQQALKATSQFFGVLKLFLLHPSDGP